MSADVTTSADRSAAAFLDTRARVPLGRQVWGAVLRSPIGLLGGIIVALVILVALFADLLAPFDPVSQLARPLQPTTSTYLLGTDELGRDVLSRVIQGSRVSLYVGI